MKVLLFTLEYPPFYGGVSKYYEKIVSHWPESRGISVLNNNDGKLIDERLPAFKWLPSFSKLRSAMKNHKADHILVGQVLPLGIVAYAYSLFWKTDYTIILHFMDYEYANKTWKKRWITKKIIGRACSIICNNSVSEERVKRNIVRPDKVIIVNPGVDEADNTGIGRGKDIRKKHGLENRIILFSIGRLVKRKGFDMVIQAMPRILEQVPDLAYCLAGSGPDEEYLKGLVDKLPESSKNNTILLGKLDEKDKWEWLDACDIFATIPRNIEGDVEGFGVVFLEANLAGKPVIAGDSGGVKDAVINGETGLVVDPEDASKIAEAIVRLARDSALRVLFGKQGRSRAVEEFGWASQTKKLYAHIAKGSV